MGIARNKLTKFGFLVMQVQELDLYLAQRTQIFLLCTSLTLNSTLVPSFTSITLRVHLLYIYIYCILCFFFIL